MESVFSSLRIERVKRKVYCTRDHARADIFDDIERFCNPTRCHSTIGYPSPIQYDERAMETQGAAHETGSNSDRHSLILIIETLFVLTIALVCTLYLPS